MNDNDCAEMKDETGEAPRVMREAQNLSVDFSFFPSQVAVPPAASVCQSVFFPFRTNQALLSDVLSFKPRQNFD